MNDVSETGRDSEHGRRVASDARAITASRRASGPPEETTRDQNDASAQESASEETCIIRSHETHPSQRG